MVAVKITGLDELESDLVSAQHAFKSLDGVFTRLKINPDDPASVQEAISAMEAAIDDKVGLCGRSKLVRPIIDTAKAEYRKRILKITGGAS